jgi:2,5-diketo-D-gluconate reductase A
MVATALAAGYHLDTAAAYGNEAQVGEAVREAGENVYVTTKYFNPGEDHGRADAIAAFGASPDRLGLDHIDLYLIHWPVRAERASSSPAPPRRRRGVPARA